MIEAKKIIGGNKMAVQIKYNYFKNKDTFRREFVRQVESTYAVDFKNSTTYQQYVVLGNMLRKHVAYDWKQTEKAIKSQKLRSVTVTVAALSE